MAKIRTCVLDYERHGTIRHATMRLCIDAQRRSEVCARIAQFQSHELDIAIYWQREAAAEHQIARERLERLIGIN